MLTVREFVKTTSPSTIHTSHRTRIREDVSIHDPAVDPYNAECCYDKGENCFSFDAAFEPPLSPAATASLDLATPVPSAPILAPVVPSDSRRCRISDDDAYSGRGSWSLLS